MITPPDWRPPELSTPRLVLRPVTEADAAAIFKRVVPAGGRMDSDLALGGLVTELQGDYRAQPGKAVLGMDLYLVRVDATGEVVFQKSYRKEVELAAKSPEGLVRGLNEALRLILVDLEADLRRLGGGRNP